MGRLRFRLRTLLIAVVLSALGLGYVQAWRRWEPRRRADVLVDAILADRAAERPRGASSRGDFARAVGVVAASLIVTKVRRKALTERSTPAPGR